MEVMQVMGSLVRQFADYSKPTETQRHHAPHHAFDTCIALLTNMPITILYRCAIMPNHTTRTSLTFRFDLF